MLESTRERSYLNFETESIPALLQGKPYKASLENSLSPTQPFMEQNITRIMPRERISMWTT